MNKTRFLHQSRGPGGLTKIRQKSSGLVFECQPPTATEMVLSGLFDWASWEDDPSIRECLLALPLSELEELAAEGGVRTSGEQRDFIVTQLIPLVEIGDVVLSSRIG